MTRVFRLRECLHFCMYSFINIVCLKNRESKQKL